MELGGQEQQGQRASSGLSLNSEQVKPEAGWCWDRRVRSDSHNHLLGPGGVCASGERAKIGSNHAPIHNTTHIDAVALWVFASRLKSIKWGGRFLNKVVRSVAEAPTSVSSQGPDCCPS